MIPRTTSNQDKISPIPPTLVLPKTILLIGHSYPDFPIFCSLSFASFSWNSCSHKSTIHTIQHSDKVIDENSFSTRNSNLIRMSNNTRVLEKKAILKETFNDTTVQGIQIKFVKQTANIVKLPNTGRT